MQQRHQAFRVLRPPPLLHDPSLRTQPRCSVGSLRRAATGPDSRPRARQRHPSKPVRRVGTATPSWHPAMPGRRPAVRALAGHGQSPLAPCWASHSGRPAIAPSADSACSAGPVRGSSDVLARAAEETGLPTQRFLRQDDAVPAAALPGCDQRSVATCPVALPSAWTTYPSAVQASAAERRKACSTRGP